MCRSLSITNVHCDCLRARFFITDVIMRLDMNWKERWLNLMQRMSQQLPSYIYMRIQPCMIAFFCVTLDSYMFSVLLFICSFLNSAIIFVLLIKKSIRRDVRLVIFSTNQKSVINKGGKHKKISIKFFVPIQDFSHSLDTRTKDKLECST